MSADWEEVKRLAADFQRAQLISTVQRLSERNCIEIVKKLIELKLIDVIFTTDGKEYLTPQRVLKEIRDELIVHKGRINFVDLAKNLGIDFSHVETKGKELASSEPGTQIVQGQLVTNDYLDYIAEEINERLKVTGQITIAELAKTYDFSGEFLQKAISSRLGKLIDAQVDSADHGRYFTKAFVNQHTARIRGALSALTRPVAVASLVKHFGFPESLFFTAVEKLIKNGRLSGSLSGGKTDKAVYTPGIFTQSQNDWVDNFYHQNGYLEYDQLTRLGIQEPKAYLHRRFKNESLTMLDSCCIGKNIMNQVKATIEEALRSGTWVDVTPCVPSIISTGDLHNIITNISKSASKQGTIVRVYCDSIVVSDEFIKACSDSFEGLMTAKAQEDIVKKPQLFVDQSSRGASQKAEDISGRGRQDKKEEKKKKGAGGKPGGGTQGRETKTKSVKKKYFTSKGGNDSDSDGESTLPRDARSELEFLDIDGIETHLKTLKDLVKDCPEELISEIAVELHSLLARKYREIAITVFEFSVASSSGARKKQHSEYQEKFSSLLGHIIMFEKGIKLFFGDTGLQLVKHLLKTLCTDLVNSIVTYLAQEHTIISGSDCDSTLTTEVRHKLILKFNAEFKKPLMDLHNSLATKTLDDFHSTIDAVLGAGICDMIIRKPDKKKERLLLANHKQSLISQLSDTTDPALCLHLAVLLMFQTQAHNMLHASGKFVPHIAGYLQKQVPFEVYQLITSYQEMVMKKLTASGSEDEELQRALIEEMPKIKETAITFKKTSVSETEN